MVYIPIPTTMLVNSSVSADHLINLYAAVTGGVYDIKVSDATFDDTSVSGTSITGYSAQKLSLNLTDGRSYGSDPIDRINGHINTVMEAISLSADSDTDGRMYYVGWTWGVSPAPVYESRLLTVCMQYATASYKWVFVESYLTEWQTGGGL